MSCLQGMSESPDLEFEYSDTDKWVAELSGMWMFISTEILFGQSLQNIICMFRLVMCSLCMFQSCTVTLKDQSLLSTGPALRWNSENMVYRNLSSLLLFKSILFKEGISLISAFSVSLVSDKKWIELDAAQHRAHAMRLLDSLEVIAREKRLKVARAILYMAQGQFTSVKVLNGWENGWSMRAF